MPTPIRRFRAEDALWETAQDKAAAAGDNLSDIIRDALERYNAGIGVEQQPDDTVYVVRWRNRPSGPRARVDQWSYSTPVPEPEARTMFRQMRRNMKTAEVQLIRRADYVIEQN